MKERISNQICKKNMETGQNILLKLKVRINPASIIVVIHIDILYVRILWYIAHGTLLQPLAKLCIVLTLLVSQKKSQNFSIPMLKLGSCLPSGVYNMYVYDRGMLLCMGRGIFLTWKAICSYSELETTWGVHFNRNSVLLLQQENKQKQDKWLTNKWFLLI